jgi:hypothetical protein
MINVVDVQSISLIAKEVQNVSKDPQVQSKVTALLDAEKGVAEQVAKVLKQAQDTQAFVNYVRIHGKPPVEAPIKVVPVVPVAGVKNPDHVVTQAHL